MTKKELIERIKIFINKIPTAGKLAINIYMKNY